jgi:hypothetical protein
MEITNNLNLPEPLVRAVSRHPRERRPDMISVSELIQPPQLRALSVTHDAELSDDAGDRIWALLGTLMHHALEQNAKGLSNVMAEQELKTTVLGWELVGHYDLSEMVLDGEILTDYKLTSVWAVKDGIKREWEEQLNVYAQLIRLAGRRVDQLQIVAIGRDWSKSKAKFDSTYPQQQVKVFSVPLWTSEETMEFIKVRIKLHQAAAKGSWPDCTEDERWARSTVWAVMKQGQKKAVKLHSTKEAADRHAELLVAHYVVERLGESVRCENYCSVATVCPQFARIKNAA